MKNVIQDGNIIDWTNSTGSDVNAGAVVPMGKIVGVAVTKIANGETGPVAVEGVFELPKKTSTDTMAVGDHVHYNSGIVKTAGSAGATIGKDVVVGYVVAASSSAQSTAKIKLAH